MSSWELVRTLLRITRLAHRKSYLIIICPNSHEKLTKGLSLLPTISKIAEQIMHKRVALFLEANNILCQNQFEFRANRSTIDAVTKLIKDVTVASENIESIIAVFLDLSKAFYTNSTTRHSISYSIIAVFLDLSKALYTHKQT